MAQGDEFYHRDRPENPRPAEDRPRGGGPEEVRHGGGRKVVITFVLLAVLVLVLFLLFI